MSNPDGGRFLRPRDHALAVAGETDAKARDREARDRAEADSRRAHPTTFRPVRETVIGMAGRTNEAIADRQVRDAAAITRPIPVFRSAREVANKRAGEIDARSKYIAQRDRMRQLPVRIPGPARGRKG